MLTCMKKKKAKFKSYSIQNVMMVACIQKMLKIKSLLNGRELTCMQKKVKIMFNSIQNAREIRCMHQRANIKSNFMQEAMVVTCMQMEARAPHSIKSLSSTDSLVGFDE